MAKDRTELILKGGMYRVLVYLSTPIIINSLIQTLYNLVDGLWVSRISSVHFAATTFVWPVNWIFVSLGSGLSVAGTSLLSQLLGAGQESRAREYSAQLTALSLLTSLLFAAVGYLSAPLIVGLMGGAGELAELSILYLRIIFFELPAVFLYFAIYSMLHAQGDTITPMIFSAASAILNAILDPIFIFTFNWGLAG
ncbi:MAG: MATE family efflux transporter, partial [Firmicutes bacterium]|nr:MATE family efflux transporter [Bacillota bacterium]